MKGKIVDHGGSHNLNNSIKRSIMKTYSEATINEDRTEKVKYTATKINIKKEEAYERA